MQLHEITRCAARWLIVLSVSLIRTSSSEVHRLYTLTSENGRSHACGSERVILTCHATGARVTWTAVSDLTGRIVFIGSDPAWTVLNQGAITGILLQNEPESDGNNMRNFISELLVYTGRSTSAINVTCSSDSGSTSHVIAPSAHPGQPTFKKPRLLMQSNLSAEYYLEWKPPLNRENFDLDHYQLYANDNLLRVHSDQHYAVITVENDVTTIVKIAAADKCGQVSSNGSVSITPITPNNTNNLVEPQMTMTSTIIYDDHTTATANGDSGGQDCLSKENMISISPLVVIICTMLIIVLIIGVAVAVLVVVVLYRRRKELNHDAEMVHEVNKDFDSLPLDTDSGTASL